MIESVPNLSTRERTAVATLLFRLLDTGEPVRRAILFGSKARGDFDNVSDVDVLLLYDGPPDDRDALAAAATRAARAIAARTGIVIEPWAVPAADLEPGGRTPMLVDALRDGLPLWPRGAPPIRVDFTHADARFCAGCLLDWVAAGGPIVRRALRDGRRADAARRARDDITRVATAALLLTGDTRHRRAGSLRRFEDRFVRPRFVSLRVLPALAWARAAYPADGGRGERFPEVTARAAASARLGHDLAAIMEHEVVPLILDGLAA